MMKSKEPPETPRPGDPGALAPADDVPGTPVSAEVTEHMSVEVWRGPLPNPTVLRGFEEVLPGAAERLFDLYETQSQHRMGLERDTAQTARKVHLRGQWMAYTLSLAGVLGYVSQQIWGRGGAAWATGVVIVPIVGLPAVLSAVHWLRAARRQPSAQNTEAEVSSDGGLDS